VLIPRVIPSLLIEEEVFVKTTRYQEPMYVGDPVNVINLFNRFEVDEILLLGIRATQRGESPPFALIEQLAAECWVPLTYGGGITSFDEARRILAIGVERVVLGTAAATQPDLISRIADTFGRQAVVVSVDARREAVGNTTWIEGGRRKIDQSPRDLARAAEAAGAGEIIVNAIDRDGTMLGYDLELIREITASVQVPVIASCGAGSRLQLVQPWALAGASAVAAGSLFVYQGPERGVLINFPDRAQLEGLFASATRRD
jgi:cyclase